MTEDEIKLEVRLYAIEIFAANLLAMECLRAAPDAALQLSEQIRDQAIRGARQQTFPDVDAAMSDLLSAELEAAVTRLANLANAQIRVVLQARRG